MAWESNREALVYFLDYFLDDSPFCRVSESRLEGCSRWPVVPGWMGYLEIRGFFLRGPILPYVLRSW